MKKYSHKLLSNQAKLLSDKLKCEHSYPNPNLKDKDTTPSDNVSANYEYKHEFTKWDKTNKRFDVTGVLTSPLDESKEKEKEKIIGNRENIFQKEDGIINKLNRISEENVEQHLPSKVDKKPEDQISS